MSNQINNLNTVTNPSPGDLLPLFVTNSGYTGRIPLSQLATVLPTFAPKGTATEQYIAIDNIGQTVTLNDNGSNNFAILSSAVSSSFSTITAQLPFSPVNQQTITIVGNISISNLVFSVPTGFTLVGANPANFVRGTSIQMTYDAVTKTWYRTV